jgi:VWFA-related protein
VPLLIVLAMATTAPVPRAGDGEARFLAPRPRATALGATPVEVAITPPAGAETVRVELRVDQAPLATLDAPPWTATWDAGDGTRGHTLEAVVTFSDGTTARATVSTSRLRINAVEEVDLVNLYAVVRDPRGRYVDGLTAADFTLLEDGREQTIKVFTSDPKPLAVAILIDTSTTMEGGKIEAARESAAAFVRALAPRDRGMIVGFADRVRVLQDLTADPEALRAAIESTEARGGTALYDAIWKGADALRGVPDARRVLVLLSDGRDEAANGLEPGSLHTMQEALDHALRCEVMVYAIGFGRPSDLEQKDFFGRFTQAQVLGRLAEETGGSLLYSRRTGALRKAFDTIADDLRHQYSLAYSSDNEVKDGAWREIALVPDDTNLDVVTRSGYYATRPGSGAGH